MTNQSQISPNLTARWAGALYLMLIPLGFFWFLYVPTQLVVSGDMASTMNNFLASEGMFRLSIVAGLLMNITTIALALVLFQLFRSVGKYNAIFMVVFLLAGATIAMVSEVSMFAALKLSNVAVGGIFEPEQAAILVELQLDNYGFGINIAAIFWGLWLFPLGYLVMASRFMPKILGILLIIAGIGYVVDSFVFFLVPGFGFTFSDYTFIGEVTFTLWLVFKGVDLSRYSA